MFYVNKNNITEISNEITVNSDMFGDEVDSVYCQLKTFVDCAEAFGTKIIGRVKNMYGESVYITAVPSATRHEWSF